MKRPDQHPERNRSPEALRAFLGQCQQEAAEAGEWRLASISIETDHLDPLAVLESIYEQEELHFYCEHPAERWALAGAEAVLSFSAEGKDRFAKAREFVQATLERTIAVGNLELPFAGPHFLGAFAFFPETGEGADFPAARLFVPRWQVGRRREVFSAVANLLIDADSDLEFLTRKVWNAHRKFSCFSYANEAAGERDARQPARFSASEVGGQAWFEAAVSQALEAIADGAYQKVVLARAHDLNADAALHPLRLLNGLRRRFPDCYAFSVANGRGASFIGASPEELVRLDNGEVRTEALAGSAPRGRSAAEDARHARDLLRSEKDLREHRLVLESIRRRLEALGLRLEHPPRPELLQLSNVQHLHTPVSARLPAGRDLLDLVAALHPTPAVGGTPREPACQGILRLEPFDRGLYAGPLGWLDFRGEGEFIVAIRSALVAENRARLFAGAGIVPGSDPKLEFAETELKFHALRDALLADVRDERIGVGHR